jgi:uncharacterized protein GlcG (DUF336 family)
MNRNAASSLVAVCIITLTAAWWPFGAGRATAARTDSCCEAVSNSTDGVVTVKHTLTLDGANRVLAAAVAKAIERKARGAIAVVDDGGNLIALQRLDGTFAAGAGVSTGKARTAALFRKPTKAFEDSINGGRTALAAVAEMTPLQGGVLIMHEGHIVGAIGVSGAHSQVEDEEIAMAGAAAISDTSAAK